MSLSTACAHAERLEKREELLADLACAALAVPVDLDTVLHLSEQLRVWRKPMASLPSVDCDHHDLRSQYREVLREIEAMNVTLINEGNWLDLHCLSEQRRRLTSLNLSYLLVDHGEASLCTFFVFHLLLTSLLFPTYRERERAAFAGADNRARHSPISYRHSSPHTCSGRPHAAWKQCTAGQHQRPCGNETQAQQWRWQQRCTRSVPVCIPRMQLELHCAPGIQGSVRASEVHLCKALRAE
jgi:hypothetical protein